MAERWQPTDAELESALIDLGRRLEYPRTPLLARAVRERLAAAARPSLKERLAALWETLRPAQRAFALAALAVVLLAGAVFSLFPDARTTVAHWLGLRGVVITNVPSPLPTPLRTLPPGPVGQRLNLGEKVILADAQSHVRFHVLVPAALGDPDEVYFLEPPAGGEVSLVYFERPAVPQTAQTGVGLLLTEFRGDLEPGFFGKGLGPGTRLVEVRVRGVTGYWIEGMPHLFFYRDSSGNVRDETLRLAANTLIWEEAGVTVRIESSLRQDQALRIAESLR